MTADNSGDPRSRSIRLGDGRRLGYTDLGDHQGDPVFYFHGWPGSRLDTIPTIGAAERTGIRLISIDRPGFGLSDPAPGRRLIHWPNDVSQLADQLHIDRFSILGWSGGGPSVAACAWALPDRLQAAGIVAGWSEMSKASLRREAGDRMMLGLAARFPVLLGPVMGLMALAARRLPARVLIGIVAQDLAEVDKQILADPGVTAAAVASGREAFARGGSGAADDLKATVSDWGFRLEDIATPIHLWEGTEDQSVTPPIMADYRQRLKNHSYVEYPGEGHLIFYTRAEEIFRTLVAR